MERIPRDNGARPRHRNGVGGKLQGRHRRLSSNAPKNPGKTHICQVCDQPQRGFRNSNDLDRHMRTVHSQLVPGDKYWLCKIPDCKFPDKQWPRLDNFLHHITSIHGESHVKQARNWYRVVSATDQRSERHTTHTGSDAVHAQLQGSSLHEPSVRMEKFPHSSHDHEIALLQLWGDPYFQVHSRPGSCVEIDAETLAASEFLHIDLNNTEEEEEEEDDEYIDGLSDEEYHLALQFGLEVVKASEAFLCLDLSGTRSHAPQPQSSAKSGSPSKASSSRKRKSDSQNTGQKKRRLQDDEDDEDDQLGGRRPTGPQCPRPTEEEQKKKFFACPFNKANVSIYSHHNRSKSEYRHCGTSRFQTIALVKQHLVRAHQYPKFYCDICFKKFKKREERKQHVQQRSCIAEPDPFINEKMTDDAAEKLKKKCKRGLDSRSQWFEIFEILFPDRERPNSPYVDTDITGHRLLLECFRQLGRGHASIWFRRLIGPGWSGQPLGATFARIIHQAFQTYEAEMNLPRPREGDLATTNMVTAVEDQHNLQPTAAYHGSTLPLQSPTSAYYGLNGNGSSYVSSTAAGWQDTSQPTTSFHASTSTQSLQNWSLISPSVPGTTPLDQAIATQDLQHGSQQQDEILTNWGQASENASVPPETAMFDDAIWTLEPPYTSNNSTTVNPSYLQHRMRDFMDGVNRSDS